MIRSYAELLRLPGASAAAVPAALARLAGTMVPLALLLTLVRSGHSIAAGGAAGAAYALGGAVAGPALGRLMDRLGPAPVLRVTGPVAGLVLAWAAFGADGASAAVLIGAAATAGLATAPVGASVRAMWPGLTEDAALRQRAYSFEATLSELLFILGPTAVTVLGSLVGARPALLVTAVLLGTGALGYSQAGVVRRRRPQPRPPAPEGSGGPAGTGARRSGPSAASLSVLAAIALTAALSSALAVAVTAALRDQGSAAELAGSMVALQSAGSVLGGLLYGARTPRGSTFRRYIRLLIVLAVALAALPAVQLAHRAGLPSSWTLVALGALLVLTGLPIAPAGAEEFQLIGEMTAQQKMTQAFAGVGSFIAVGAAVGSAVAGLVAETLGPAVALCLPALFTALALLVSLAARRPITAALAPAEQNAPGARLTPHPTPDIGDSHA
ncbi:MFS transporter [Streptomyces sp. NBC_00503]|uniref:MFS transporter n=1 Tax=Streptomyces sp. NBC_00503 TaxID=2903659 RepID=UPI002E820A18|nr:MFS transporter [Streptomyces sp. NBC_00503]WUD79680.1 MFS transporter [Streptomyces sp. NBC_00503]